MDYLIDGIIIVFVLSCIIFFYNAAKSYFEYKDAKSSKFKVNIRYGKIGADGQTSLKELSTPAEAKAHAEKQAAGKVKKGYKEAPKELSGWELILDLKWIEYRRTGSKESRKENASKRKGRPSRSKG